ncbi:hypothetical protein Q9292_07420 [Methylophilus sp. VKM B-3414]|uniref:hypothetical protein n=1 Tax=Methylophilus sp. VKM B-3414 TaxID=3076121 RepID=UPI0028C9AE9E|nr:hypothetical protein [Methylophilus sp. VKM B-3414]MDT7849435.1 hypothetical protein [Methylophilus sp. VKM B-3414]
MEITKNYSYVHVTSSAGESYDVGPFEVSGALRFSDSDAAIDWIYKQIGLIKIQHPDASLIKHRWKYSQKSGGIFGEDAVVDIKVEIAEFFFEIHPLKTPKYANVIDELIERDESKNA